MNHEHLEHVNCFDILTEDKHVLLAAKKVVILAKYIGYNSRMHDYPYSGYDCSAGKDSTSGS